MEVFWIWNNWAATMTNWHPCIHGCIHPCYCWFFNLIIINPPCIFSYSLNNHMRYWAALASHHFHCRYHSYYLEQIKEDYTKYLLTWQSLQYLATSLVFINWKAQHNALKKNMKFSTWYLAWIFWDNCPNLGLITPAVWNEWKGILRFGVCMFSQLLFYFTNVVGLIFIYFCCKSFSSTVKVISSSYH
jgi:hypothetical protein